MSTGAPLPERVTMPLLTLVGRGAVDEDYAFVARRRVASGAPAARPSRHLLAAVGIAAFGVLIAVAAVQTSRNAATDSASRALLVQRIEARRAALADQKRQLRSLRQDTADLLATRRRLDGTLSGAEAQLSGLQTSAGFLPASGPGVSYTVDDAADGDADGRIRASDLQLLVNALWQSGADAVAVNGRRLTTVSSIVNANISVQVNRGPVSPPYVVAAVGEPTRLAQALTTAPTGEVFASLADRYGFRVQSAPVTDLVLAAAPDAQLRLRKARPVTPDPADQEGGS